MFFVISSNQECPSPSCGPSVNPISDEKTPPSHGNQGEKVEFSPTSHFDSSRRDNAIGANGGSNKLDSSVFDGQVEETMKKGRKEKVSALEKSRMKKRSLERKLAAWKEGTTKSRISRRNSTGSFDELPSLVDCDEPDEPVDLLDTVPNPSDRTGTESHKSTTLSFPTGRCEEDIFDGRDLKGLVMEPASIHRQDSMPPLVDCDENETDQDESLRTESHSRSLTTVSERTVEAFDDDSVTITIKTQRANLSHLLSAINKHGTSVVHSSTADEEESILSMAEFPPQGHKQNIADLVMANTVGPKKKKRGRRASMGSIPQVSTGSWITQLFDQGSRRQANSTRDSRCTQSGIDKKSNPASCEALSLGSHRFQRWKVNRKATMGSKATCPSQSQPNGYAKKSGKNGSKKASKSSSVFKGSPQLNSQDPVGKAVSNDQARPNSTKSILTCSTRSVNTSNSSKWSSSSLNNPERTDFNQDCGKSSVASSKTTNSNGSCCSQIASESNKSLDDQLQNTNEDKVKMVTEQGDSGKIVSSEKEVTDRLKSKLWKPSSHEFHHTSSVNGAALTSPPENLAAPTSKLFMDVEDARVRREQICPQRRESTGRCNPVDPNTYSRRISNDFSHPKTNQKFAQHLDSKHIRRMNGKLSESRHSSSKVTERTGNNCMPKHRRASTGGGYMLDLASMSPPKRQNERNDVTTERPLCSLSVPAPKEFVSSSTLIPLSGRMERRRSTGSGYPLNALYDLKPRKLEDHFDSNHLREISARDADVILERSTELPGVSEDCLFQARSNSSGCGYSVDSPSNCRPMRVEGQSESCHNNGGVGSGPNFGAIHPQRSRQGRRMSTGGSISIKSEYPSSPRKLEAHLDSHHLRNLKGAAVSKIVCAREPDGILRQERRRSTGGGVESPYASYPRELVQHLDSRQLQHAGTGPFVSRQSSPDQAPTTKVERKEASVVSLSRSDSQLSKYVDTLEQNSSVSSFQTSKSAETQPGASDCLPLASPALTSVHQSRPSSQLEDACQPRSNICVRSTPSIRESESGNLIREKQESAGSSRPGTSASKKKIDSSPSTAGKSNRRTHRRASTGSSSAFTTSANHCTPENTRLVEKKAGMASRLSLGILRGSKHDSTWSKSRWNH